MTEANRHPPTLAIFFGTEMWERYGFYVVQTLLALYLAMHFKWHDRRVYALVGSFTALTYLSPVIGGWIADKLLGQKRAILLGAFTLFASYCILAAIASDLALTAALAGIAVGTGLLKPNISSLLGNEYPPDSSRRESGFTIFYMGITSGIILGTTLPSQLNYYFGWSASFFSAAIGLILAALVFIYGIKRYQINDYTHHDLSLGKLILSLVLMIALWTLSFYTLNYPRLADMFFAFVVVLCISYLLFAIHHESYQQAKKTLVIGLLCIISVIFWAFYFQMFLSLTLFIARVVEPQFLGIQFPAPYYVSIQSLGMLVFGYILARKRLKLDLIARGINIARKFLLAMLFISLAYVLIALVIQYSPDDHLISPLLIIPAYLLISLAELLLSPVGLAAITILASRERVSTMMGIFFVSLGLGGFLAGKLAAITAISPQETNELIIKSQYASGFNELLVILVIASVFCVLLYWIIKTLLEQLRTTA